MHCNVCTWFLKYVDLTVCTQAFIFSLFSGEVISLKQTGINLHPSSCASHSWHSSPLEV